MNKKIPPHPVSRPHEGGRYFAIPIIIIIFLLGLIKVSIKRPFFMSAVYKRLWGQFQLAFDKLFISPALLKRAAYHTFQVLDTKTQSIAISHFHYYLVNGDYPPHVNETFQSEVLKEIPSGGGK